MNKWISVKDGMPDTMLDKSAYSGWRNQYAPTDDVLCYIGKENRQTVAWFSWTYNEWTTTEECVTYMCDEITHWMPLPDPPKEVEHEVD